MKRNLLFIFTFFTLNGLFAEANYVYHDPMDMSGPGCNGLAYRTPLTPISSQSIEIAFKVEWQGYWNQARIYYTTDGSAPSGAFGVGSGTTQVVNAGYQCQHCNCGPGGVNVDVVKGTIPAQIGNVNVRYIVSAWNSSGGDEIFSNGCGNCGTENRPSSAATVYSLTVLPIELTRFDVKTTENQVQLTWETASETNNKLFQIERSPEAQNWFMIAEMAGAGNSRDAIQYNFTDLSPLAGTSFYRLRQVDFDGFSSLSIVRQIERKQSEVVSIYPNPALNGRFIVSTMVENETDLRVDLLDMMGRVVRVMDFTAQKGENNLEFLTDNLPEGMYSVRLFNGFAELTSQKISIKNR